MKKVAFIGGFDKFDIILYTAIIIAKQTNKKILFMDVTTMQKPRYIVPTMEQGGRYIDKYITTFQGLDVAIGFKNKSELESAVSFFTDKKDEKGNPVPVYDYLFIDSDDANAINSFDFNPSHDLIFFTTSFEKYSIEKGLDVIKGLNVNIPINRILLDKNIKREHLAYITNATQGYNFSWGNININFPYDNGDWTIIYENQRANRLNLRPFSKQFKSAIKNLVQVISELGGSRVSTTMKNIEKEQMS